MRTLDFYLKNESTANSSVCEDVVEFNKFENGDGNMENKKITVPDLVQNFNEIADYTITHKEELKSRVESIMQPVASIHQLSARNFLLAQSQYFKRTGEIEKTFASYSKWQDLGRQVKYGSKGLKILVPMFFKVKNDDDEVEDVRVYFKVANTFAASDTLGKPLDNIGLLENKGLISYSDVESRIKVPIHYTHGVLTHGYTDGNSIYISKEFSKDEQLSCLFHELAHIRLGHFDKKVRENTSKFVRECQAESVAYILTTAIGFDNDKSSSYLANYDFDENILKGSGSKIITTAFNIVKELKINELLLAKNKEYGFIDKDVEI